MSINVKNARVVYDFTCPVCDKGLVLQNYGNLTGKTNRHLTIDHCLRCETRLSIDYNKVRNEVVATVRELKDEL